MNRRDWGSWAAKDAVIRRAGGRRRYNAQRRQQAEERRARILAWMGEQESLVPFLLARGLAAPLAAAFGVHRTTAWRDLKLILLRPKEWRYRNDDGVHLFSVFKEPGGRIVRVEDPDGKLIRGQARRDILRRIRRKAAGKGS